MARHHEQTATPEPAKTNVCATLWQINSPDGLAGRVEDHNSIVPRTTAPTAPQISINIDAKTVGNASMCNGDKRSTVGEPGAIVDDFVSPKYLRGCAVFYDVQLCPVRREGESIRPVDVTDHNRRLSSLVER